MYNHRRPLNDPGVDCRGGLPHNLAPNPLADNLSLDVAARSRHPGGVHVLFGDGGARFVTDAVNHSVWRALGSRDGQEVVSGSSY